MQWPSYSKKKVGNDSEREREWSETTCKTKRIPLLWGSGADTGFSEGGGGGDGHKGGGGWSGVIAPVGEKLLFEHTKFSATRGGGDHPYHPPVSATGDT